MAMTMESELLALTRDGVDFFRAALSAEGELRVEKFKHLPNVSIAQWSPKGDAVTEPCRRCLSRKSARRTFRLSETNFPVAVSEPSVRVHLELRVSSSLRSQS